MSLRTKSISVECEICSSSTLCLVDPQVALLLGDGHTPRLTRVGGLVHGHRQLHDVVHPLRVLGFQGLLTHDPLLHQEPEGFGRVGSRAAVPLREEPQSWIFIGPLLQDRPGEDSSRGTLKPRGTFSKIQQCITKTAVH